MTAENKTTRMMFGGGGEGSDVGRADLFNIWTQYNIIEEQERYWYFRILLSIEIDELAYTYWIFNRMNFFYKLVILYKLCRYRCMKRWSLGRVIDPRAKSESRWTLKIPWKFRQIKRNRGCCIYIYYADSFHGTPSTLDLITISSVHRFYTTRLYTKPNYERVFATE